MTLGSIRQISNKADLGKRKGTPMDRAPDLDEIAARRRAQAEERRRRAAHLAEFREAAAAARDWERRHGR